MFALVGGDGSTGYAQFALADAAGIIPIPTGLSSDEAAAIVVAGSTVVLTLTEVGQLQAGETVLIEGAGGGVIYDPALNQSLRTFNLGLYLGLRPQAAVAVLQTLMGYVASGQVAVHVGHVLPLAHAARAHRLVENRQSTGKVVLKPWLDA